MRPVEQQLARGDFKFHLTGEKLRGEFALVRIKSAAKGNEWLLLKKKDAFAQPGWDTEDHARSVLTGRTQEEIARELAPSTRRSARPSRHALRRQEGAITQGRQARLPCPKHRAHAGRARQGRRPSDDDWLYEIKWDGVRALCYLETASCAWSPATATRMERQYPELSDPAASRQGRQAILDGEIAALDPRASPASNCSSAASRWSEPSAIATLARAPSRWCSSSSTCCISTATISAASP